VQQWFEPVLNEVSADRRERLLDGAAGLAEPVVRSGEPAGWSAESVGLLHGLYWLTVNLAAEQPLLLLLDDGQWADEPSLRLLNHLAPRLEGIRVGLIIACRPPGLDEGGELLARLIAEPSVPILRPGVLTLEGTARMIAELFGHAPEPQFVDACHAATGGNPFYLSELGRAMAEQGPSAPLPMSRG
jgi:hypothetical protein